MKNRPVSFLLSRFLPMQRLLASFGKPFTRLWNGYRTAAMGASQFLAESRQADSAAQVLSLLEGVRTEERPQALRDYAIFGLCWSENLMRHFLRESPELAGRLARNEAVRNVGSEVILQFLREHPKFSLKWSSGMRVLCDLVRAGAVPWEHPAMQEGIQTFLESPSGPRENLRLARAHPETPAAVFRAALERPNSLAVEREIRAEAVLRSPLPEFVAEWRRQVGQDPGVAPLILHCLSEERRAALCDPQDWLPLFQSSEADVREAALRHMPRPRASASRQMPPVKVVAGTSAESREVSRKR